MFIHGSTDVRSLQFSFELLDVFPGHEHSRAWRHQAGPDSLEIEVGDMTVTAPHDSLLADA